MELRDYQRRCVDVVEQADRSGVVVAPTGSGKSLIIKELADRWQKAGHNVIVVVAELSVSRQLSSEKYGLRCVHPSALADIAALHDAPATRLIVDEVHHYVPTANGGGVWGDWVWKNWAWGRVVGFTATPAHPFLKKRIIVQIPYYYLREGQWLAPPVSAVICADSVPALPTAAHAVTYIAKKEDWEPWMGRLITAETPADERHFKPTDAGRLSCIQTLTTGWDDPDIDTVVLARRVGEAHTYMQIIGRLRRGGTIYDMSDNVVRFGLDEDIILATHEKRDKEGTESVEGVAVLTTCLQCDRLVSPRLKQCPYCGAALPPPAGKTWVKLDDAGWKVWLDAFAPARLERLCDGRRPCPYTPSGAYPIQLPIKEQIYFSPKTYHHWKKVSDLLYDLRHRGALMCYIPHSWHILVQQKYSQTDAVPPFYITSIEYGSPLVWQRFSN